MSQETTLAFDALRGGPPFPATGTYELYVVYRDDLRQANSELRSEPITVTVHEPADREAYLAYTPELARFAQPIVGTYTDGTLENAVRFVERFPDSAYAPGLRDRLLFTLQGRVGAGKATDDEKAILARLRDHRGSR